MPSFSSTMVSFTSLLAVTSAAPLVARSVCGASGSGSGSVAPLSSPTGITTAEACLAQCNSAASCQSFLFGLLNGVPTCELFNVAASALPATTNFVAYDKACTSVPAIVPTTANPTGVDVSGDQSTGSTPSTGNGSTGAGTTDVSGDQNTGSNAATEKHARNVNSDNSGDPSTGAAVLASPPTAPTVVTGATHASPLNGIPAAGQAPIALGSGLANWNSLFCLAACKLNSLCVAYVYEDGQCYEYGA